MKIKQLITIVKIIYITYYQYNHLLFDCQQKEKSILIYTFFIFSNKKIVIFNKKIMNLLK